jgi:hypothetical protein
VAVYVATNTMVLVGTAITGTAPGTGSVPSGTITTSTDISGWLESVVFEYQGDEQEYTNFSSAGFRQKAIGLVSGTVQLNFNQDFAATNVDALFGLGGTLGLVPGQVTPYYIDIKPTNSARSATNPSFFAAFLNTGISSINGNVGDLAKVQASFPLTGRFIKLTS